ncbi:RNA polymerase [Parafrankia colletiae]|uniref:RNA polymerase n=1 Tax=Parafrankia colletiae TaxID=573497 RepID=A0A1S1QW66_9ACTN|nr:RNA polymerase [Parafrankia colletiae]
MPTRPPNPTPGPSTGTSTGTTPPRPPAAVTAKKGAAVWTYGAAVPALVDSGASWFYDWGPKPDNDIPPGVRFVPMIWGPGAVTPATLNQVKGYGDTLLTFNEPDLGGQADMSVERALELWPQLQATGMRLSSPAVAWGAADAGGWLDRFMTGAAQRGYRVDFITLHWYGSDFDPARATGHLRDYVQKTYERYHLPIWLTEYALMDFAKSPRAPSTEQQAEFIRQSTAMLESLPYVERYSWFGLPAIGDSVTGLYDAAGRPNAAGLAYRAAGAR